MHLASQRLKRVLFLVMLLLAYTQGSFENVGAQEPEQDSLQLAVEALPTRVKIGQLVVVTFPGTDISEDSEIAALISDYVIGGVWLRPANANFGVLGDGNVTAKVITPTALISMSNQLQRLAWRPLRAITTPLSNLPLYQGSSFPLFVAVEPEIDGFSITRFISGTSSLPAPMAVGATWNRALSEAAGQVVGSELAALGINLFLGPNLDVLDTPRPGDPADLGTSVFGGDSYWVGELGRAYVRGLHQGSQGRLAVIPRHFPGLGSADRPLSEELPTVQRSLDQLERIELAPFLAVTQQLPGSESAADGLLVTHARYQGFQGTIRQGTRPLSLDVQGLQSAMSGFGTWRRSGGLLVADDLGLPALRRFYDPRGVSFNARQVARDALLAGNDLLFLDQFGVTGDWAEHFANVRSTLDFLAQLYENDPTVRARVDEAVTRILQLKLRLNPALTLAEALRAPDLAEGVLGRGSIVNNQIASSGITRLAPRSDDLLLSAPQDGSRLVVFVQERPAALFTGGPTIDYLSRELVLQTLISLYGPDGTGQVQADRVAVHSFEDLLRLFSNPNPTPDDGSYAVARDLEGAQWVIFMTTGLERADPESGALKLFLEQRAALLESFLVVLNFGPPYDLDSTDVSKIDLYYAMYSPNAASVQTAFQALFRDLPVAGSSPVSVPALNYVLSLQVQPDPTQVIALNVVDSQGQEMAIEEIRDIRKDDVVYLRTSVIYDRNGHPVPDSTSVLFTLTYPQEDRIRTIAAATRNGVAFTSVTLDRVGQLDITVESSPAPPLFRLQLTIREESVIMISITPTPTTPDAGPTPTLEPLVTVNKSLPDQVRFPSPRRSLLVAWLLMGGLLSAVGGFWWGGARAGGLLIKVRVALWGAVGAMGAYVLVALAFRGPWREQLYLLTGSEPLAAILALCGGGAALLAVRAFLRARQ